MAPENGKQSVKHDNVESENTTMPNTALQTPEKEIAQKSPVIDTPKVQNIQEAKSQVKTQKESSKKSLSLEENTLLSRDKHRYTLQLLGASNQVSIQEFIRKHAIEQKAHSFKTKRQGKDWYVVVYGDYSSSQEAKKAANAMPSSLKNAHVQPWVREVSAVHEDIHNKG